MQTSFREGQVPAHWWVELGLGPLVGRAVSRGVFRGGCRLRNTFLSLSDDGWGFVPALLVVWPEASQHCWAGPGLSVKVAPPGELMPMSTP